ncbi:MAG: TraB/GumN family protein [Vicinamibacterales bacterium]
MRRLIALVIVVAGLGTALAAAPGEDRHFLWRVDAAGAPPTYLLGSLHVLTAGHYPLAAPIEDAFARSTVLIEEVDLAELDDPAQALLLASRALLPADRTLQASVSGATWAKVVRHVEATGLPLAAVQRMKPWMAALALTSPALAAAGYDQSNGVDRYFFDKATGAGMTRRALETVAYQVDRMDGLPPAVQDALLASAMDDIDTQVKNVDRMATAWTHGDTGALESLLLDSVDETPEVYQRLLVERNRNWVEPVARCLRERTACFVVVGAAHLVGPDSVVRLLRDRGYRVTQQ